MELASEIHYELSHKGKAERDKKTLNQRGVVSPSLNGAVKIANGTWVVPKKPIENHDEFIEIRKARLSVK